MRDEAQYWWSEERHKVEIAEAYRKGWEDAKEECAKVADDYATKTFDDPVCRTVAAAIRALKEK